MSANPNDALDAALNLLGFSEDQPVYHRSNLLRAIHAYATANRNVDLAYACEARLNLVQANEAAALRRE